MYIPNPKIYAKLGKNDGWTLVCTYQVGNFVEIPNKIGNFDVICTCQIKRMYLQKKLYNSYLLGKSSVLSYVHAK